MSTDAVFSADGHRKRKKQQIGKRTGVKAPNVLEKKKEKGAGWERVEEGPEEWQAVSWVRSSGARETRG